MEKLPICRICLVHNVRMYVVNNKNLQELYEKLTDVPFVTEDSRPMLACFFCCTKLKQFGQLQSKCLEGEELFAQMLNEDYEPNLLLNQGLLKFCCGFIISPTEQISIFDECQSESDVIKEELPEVCEALDDIIEPKEEYQNDELELEYHDIAYLDSLTDQEVIPPHHWESEDIVPLHFESEDYIPSMKFKTEGEREQKVSKKKRRANNTERATVAKKQNTDTRRAKLEDTITTQQNKNQPLDSNFTQTGPNHASKYVTKFKEPLTTAYTIVTNCSIYNGKEKLNKPNITELKNNLSTATRIAVEIVTKII